MPSINNVIAVLTILPASAGTVPNVGEHHNHNHHKHTSVVKHGAHHHKRWSMYIQPDGRHDAHGGIICEVVLISPDGKTKKIFFADTGPWEKGILPGLEGEKYLRHHEPHYSDKNDKPHIIYKIGEPEYKTDNYWMHSTGFGKHYPHKPKEADFFIPLTSKSVFGRTNLGIHPDKTIYYSTKAGRKSTPAGTAGCVGIVDGYSSEFETFWRNLASRHEEPQELEVFTEHQRPHQKIGKSR